MYPGILQQFSYDLTAGLIRLDYMGQFGQFGLNGFKRGQTLFSLLYISLDPDELESCNFVCSLLTAMLK